MKTRPYRRLMPESAVPMFGLRLVVYLDADGMETMDWKVDGDARLGQIVGAIEVAKSQMIASVKEPHGPTG